MKKTSNLIPILLGIGVIGGIGFIFRKEIASLFKKDDESNPLLDLPEIPPALLPTPAPAPIVVTPQGVVPTTETAPNKLAPLGTAKKYLNLDVNLKFGDKGQEVMKLQQILNRIAKITGKQLITEDGDFGIGTQTRLNDVINKDSVNLYKSYLILFAIWNAKNNKDLKNWFNYYQSYLTDATRLANARKYYFANNPEI